MPFNFISRSSDVVILVGLVFEKWSIEGEVAALNFEEDNDDEDEEESKDESIWAEEE